MNKNQITVKVLADSISPDDVRLTTFQLKYPRLVHSEFMTHRVFSRNASSSRAIPVAKVIAQVRADPAMPVQWGKNQPGMQAHENFEKAWDVEWCEAMWRQAANAAADKAEEMMNFGLAKQVANRILETFQFMHVVLTATEFSNWYELRDHDDADPTIHALAKAMKAEHQASTPKKLYAGEWHLPYVGDLEVQTIGQLDDFTLQNISAARCARVSYMKHDGSAATIAEELALCERLAGSNPRHYSPFEHQATPLVGPLAAHTFSGNFRGWKQFRKLHEEKFK